MRLNAFTYYADYAVHPIAAVGLGSAVYLTTPASDWPTWMASFGAGILTWPLAEYTLHRWVFHRIPPAKGMHEAHHRDGTALIGTPWWVSLPLIGALVLAPAIAIGGFALGAWFTAGIMLGYTAYMIVHHGVHHWQIEQGSVMDRLKRRHGLHHRYDPEGNYDQGNYGVVTGFWDKVFGTDLGLAAIPGTGARQRPNRPV